MSGARRRGFMRNCNAQIRRYHGAAIALTPAALRELRSRRNLVRGLIKRRLTSFKYPRPIGFRSQGSVAMGTIIQGADANYDIDDGIYFARRALQGSMGGDMAARTLRQIVWEAAYDERFADPPEMLKNCIRVYYARGYHIDIPVYRVTQAGIFAPKIVELAAADWKRSDPRAVTLWFKAANARTPGFGRDRQLARIVRYIKAWARARPAWEGRMLGGFGMTALVVECYLRWADRDDRALYDTLSAIQARLSFDLRIAHPVLVGEQICAPPKDAPVRFLLDRIGEALPRLEPLFDQHADRSIAYARWNEFFRTDFFRGPNRWLI